MHAVSETLETYGNVERAQGYRISGIFGRFIGEMFGCQHREMSRPFSRQGETYRVCIGCGARRQFDAKNWKLQGPFYYKEARTADLRRF